MRCCNGLVTCGVTSRDDLIFRIPFTSSISSPGPTTLSIRYVSQSITRLRSRWPDTELSVMAADMLFHPTLWQPRYGEHSRDAAGDAVHSRGLL